MRIVKLDNPKNYKEAGDQLLSKLNLNNIQISGLNHFIYNVIPRLLRKSLKTNKYTVRFTNWYIDRSKLLPEDICKKLKKTMEVELVVVAEIDILNKNKEGEDEVESTTSVNFVLDRFPILSETGSMIINGNEINMVSHLTKPSGLFYNPYNKEKNLSSYLRFNTIMQSALSFTNSKNNTETVTVIKGNMDFNAPGTNNRDISTTNLTNMFAYLELSPEEIQNITNSQISYNVFEFTTIDNKFKSLLDGIYINEEERERLNMQLSLPYRVTGRKLSNDLMYYSIKKKENVLLASGTVLSASIVDDLNNSDVEYLQIESDKGNMYVYTNNFVRIEDFVDEKDIPVEYIQYTTDILSGEAVKGYSKVNYYELNKVLSRVTNKNLLKLELSANSDLILGRKILNSDIKSMINLYMLNNMEAFPIEDVDSLSIKTISNISNIFEMLLTQRIYGKDYGVVRSMTEILNKSRIGNNLNSGQYDWSILNVRENNSISEKIIRAPLNSLFQRALNINPIDENSQKRQVTLSKVDGIGGVNVEYSTSETRNVHPSQIGRLCPIESPEGAKVGLTLHLATTALINQYGIIEAPFFKVDGEHRKIDFTKAYFLSYEEERYLKRVFSPKIADRDFAEVKIYKNGIEIYSKELNIVISEIGKRREISNKNSLKIIARETFRDFPDADFYELRLGMKNWFIDEIVDSIDKDGALVEIPADEVELLSCRTDHILSTTTSNIPFAQYNDGARMLMGCAMSKQAEPVVGSAPPLITTPLANKIGKEIDGIYKSPISGVVTYVSSDMIEIEPLEEDNNEKVQINLQNYRVSNEGTLINNRIIVNEGDIVLKGDIVADLNSTKNGELAVSSNLNVAYTVYDGYNYEDGIVISDRLLNEDILTSYRITEIETKFDTNQDLTYEQFMKQSSTMQYSDYNKNIDSYSNFSTLRRGTKIGKEGIVFIKYYMNMNKNELKPSIVTNSEDAGILIDIEEIGDGPIKTLKFLILTEETIKVGDKLSGRYGNKGCIAKIVPQSLMPYTEDGRVMDILLTPLGVPSRMNIGQLIESQLGNILNDLGIRIEVETGSNIDIPKIKMLTNIYTGDKDGKTQLYDGRTGKPFAQKANVGVTGIYKLKHITSHKAASRGGELDHSKYLPSGQPIKGRSRGGGQVIAEMELWAFAADNAVNNLREIQVFKSDDISSRSRFSRYLSNNYELTDDANLTQAYKKMNSYLVGMGLKMEHTDSNGETVDIYEDKHTIINKTNRRNSNITKKENKIIKHKEEKEETNSDYSNILLDMISDSNDDAIKKIKENIVKINEEDTEKSEVKKQTLDDFKFNISEEMLDELKSDNIAEKIMESSLENEEDDDDFDLDEDYDEYDEDEIKGINTPKDMPKLDEKFYYQDLYSDYEDMYDLD